MLTALLAGVVAAQERSQLPIELEAASSDVDYKSNRVRFRDVVISQGDTTVQAERAEATGLDFEDSRWVFEGDVRIRVEPQGALRSTRAIVEFRDNRIERATITGTPAQFEQQREDVTARGRARSIEYVFADGTVRLSEDAWLTDGRNEITGPVLVYNIHQQRVQAASEPGGSERVRIKIKPGKDNREQREPRDAKP
ncbi:MAG TPA: lipopolysaccharide transport periplasmic protein LptA [Steroidobacteraceae bacterium]|nr:lipopolysaccharide transport periplasmic protein LptA [Steroidobacteraceae bacterium]